MKRSTEVAKRSRQPWRKGGVKRGTKRGIRGRSATLLAGLLAGAGLSACSGVDAGDDVTLREQHVMATGVVSASGVYPLDFGGQLPPSDFASPDVPASQGQYSVTFEFGDPGTATVNVDFGFQGSSATSPIDSFDIPQRVTADLRVFVTRTLVLDQISTMTYEATVEGDAVPLYSVVIAPLRVTSVSDPTTSGFLSAQRCADCHENQYNQWRSSMMGYSSISPPIHALELTENHADGSDRTPVDDAGMGFSMGRFARDPMSNVDNPHGARGSELFCQRCHAPTATYTDVFRAFDFDYNAERGERPDSHTLLEFLATTNFDTFDPTTSPFGPLLRDYDLGDGGVAGPYFYDDPVERALIQKNALIGTEGVTCTTCHSINGIDSAVTQTRPDVDAGIGNASFRVVHNTGSEVRVNFGPYADTEVNPSSHNGGMATNSLAISGQGVAKVLGTDGVERPYIKSSEMCGSCHDVRIGAVDYGPDGQRGDPANSMDPLAEDNNDFRAVENLFSEWRRSPWNNSNDIAVSAVNFENPRPFAPAPVGAITPKTTTSCQDCHMSQYMIFEDSPVADYAMGPIADSSPDVPISNHRFIGVDRFLTHELPGMTPDHNSQSSLFAYDISEANASTYVATTSTGPDLGPLTGPSRDLREVLLQKAAEFKIEQVGRVTTGSSGKVVLPVSVSVQNVGTGHRLPAGLSEERQVWIQLEVLDADGHHVYTTGYMKPLDGSGTFQPDGDERYEDSDCRALGKFSEYACELDFFKVVDGTIGDDFNLVGASPSVTAHFELGDDPLLRNYQNGFSLGAPAAGDTTRLSNKVLTQFIGDHIINTNSLAPFEKRIEEYEIPVDHISSQRQSGPFTVNAKLRFRPLPAEFLEVLHEAFSPSSSAAFPARVDTGEMERNQVIEMAEDSCTTGDFATTDLRSCNTAQAAMMTTVAAGQGHTCIIFGYDEGNNSRYTQCFGDNESGQVGYGDDFSATLETPKVIDLINQSSAALGWEHSCALHEDGTVSCWGSGAGGRLGDGDGAPHQSSGPRMIDPAVLSGVNQIASASYTSCALQKGQKPDDDRVKCWGWGYSGDLADGKNTTQFQVQPTPTEIQRISGGLMNGKRLSGVEQIAGGHRHYCAIADGYKLNPNGTIAKDHQGNDIRTEGKVYCWGRALGAGQASDSSAPKEVALPYRATQLAAGEDFTCALTASGNTYCWGQNDSGQLGNGSSASTSPTPTLVSGEPRFSEITAGRDHACGIEKDGGQVACWGSNASGQLGNNGLTGDSNVPVSVYLEGSSVTELTGVVSIAGGGAHTCAVTGTGFPSNIWCWGDDSVGQLGINAITGNATTAIRLQNLFDAIPDLQDPMADDVGRSYYAPFDQGGPGADGCLVESIEFCNDAGDYVDVNKGDNFGYYVEAFGGMTDIYFTISMLNQTRRMGVWVNNQFIQVLQSNSVDSPRPGVEQPKISVYLKPGINLIELRDDQGTDEFDMERVRLVRQTSGNCYDNAQNQDESDVDCGGGICDGCDIGQICGGDNDCWSNNCEGGVCGEPPEPPENPAIVCNATNSVEMGQPGHFVSVPANACLKVTNYISWWTVRQMKLLRQYGTGTPSMPFHWDNTGRGSCDPAAFGSSTFEPYIAGPPAISSIDERTFGTNASVNPGSTFVTKACPTYIKLDGNASDTIQIVYYAN